MHDDTMHDGAMLPQAILTRAILAEAKAVLELLCARRLKVVTAESITGGLIAAALTDPPGSSEAVLGGFVTYCNEMKMALLGVPGELFDSVGAVSEAVARHMASGALARSGADLAVSATGLAGEGGECGPDKPVGLVYLGLARRGAAPLAITRHYSGSRAEIRAAAVTDALRMLRGASQPAP